MLLPAIAVAEDGKRRLLVVDDDRSIRRLLARVGERAGFEVDTACDGVEALEMLQKRHYAIAIVDLMMPRLSGYELVQKISTLTPRPVVLVATAMANGAVASLDDSMVRRVIKKPFDINALAQTLVETAVQIAEQQARAEQTLAAPPPDVVKIPVASAESEQTPIALAPDDSVPAEGDSPVADEPPPEKER